jgi:hypothetical protein
MSKQRLDGCMHCYCVIALTDKIDIAFLCSGLCFQLSLINDRSDSQPSHRPTLQCQSTCFSVRHRYEPWHPRKFPISTTSPTMTATHCLSSWKPTRHAPGSMSIILSQPSTIAIAPVQPHFRALAVHLPHVHSQIVWQDFPKQLATQANTLFRAVPTLPD